MAETTPGMANITLAAAVDFVMNSTVASTSAVVSGMPPSIMSAETSTMSTFRTTTEPLNTTEEAFVNPFQDMPIDSSFAWLLCALTGVFLWMIYGSCFHSRVIGYVVGSLLNQYFKRAGLGELSIGSLKLGVVSGRLAFKNVRLVTVDYSVIVYDGYLWFSYWLPYRPKQLAEFKKDSRRLFLHLYGLEVYIYNRTEAILQLQELVKTYEGRLYERSFREPRPKKEGSPDIPTPKPEIPKKSNEEKVKGFLDMRRLISVFDVKLSVFRIVLGNYRAPYCLVVGGSSATLNVTYEAASSEIDPFATVVSGIMKNAEASFQMNMDYPGDHPVCPYLDASLPNKDKLNFFSSEAVQLNRYFVDTPTDIITMLVDNRPASNEQLMKWSTELTFVGRTNLVYGGWIEKRRAEVHRAIFPPVRSEVPITSTLTQRSYDGFDLKLSTKASVYLTLYLRDSRNDVQKFVLSCDAGTEFSLFFPYVIREQGFSTTLSLKATHLRGISSLPARHLIEADEMTLKMTMKYSRVHHGPQYWNLDFGWSNGSVFFLYEHEKMIAALIDDWTRDADRPDALKFVPFHVNMDFKFNGFELITYANQHNWIDCSKNGLENTYLVFSGPNLQLGLDLDFMNFLPAVNEIPFTLSAPMVDVRMYFPESHAQLYTVASLYRQCNIETFSGKKLFGSSDCAKAFRETMPPTALWFHTLTAENFRLALTYCYHSAPHSSPDKKKKPLIEQDDTEFEPDVMELEMSLASGQLILSGSLAKMFYQLKENYFGTTQEPNNMENSLTKKLEDLVKKSLNLHDPPAKALHQRPLEVNVIGHFSNITCHLLKPCDLTDPPCPRIFVKTLVLEVLKQREETTLQVVLDTTVMEIPEANSTDYIDPMQNGQILLSFFQLRGHAMFSEADMAPGGESLEYGWLLDFQIGDVVCRANLLQIQSLISSLSALVLTADNPEDDFNHPEVMKTCLHDSAQPLCLQSNTMFLCPTIDDIKYRMTRLSVDSFHFYLVDKDSFAYLQVSPIWLSTCSLRSAEHDSGMTLLIPNCTLKQFVWSHVTPLADQDVWIEASSFKLGSLQMDKSSVANDAVTPEQQFTFLKRHDTSSHRLRFLWNDSACGCYGGTEFFGRSFTSSTWKGLSEVLDLSMVTNSAGLEVGQRIFELNEENVTLEIVSLENLLKAFKHKQHTTPKRNGSSPQMSGTGGATSSAAQQKSRGSWIPNGRRPSVGSIESFYSAAENQDLAQENREGSSDSPTVPDLLKDLDRVSVAALSQTVSQTTISTISLAPDSADRSSSIPATSSFPVNLHAQLSKRTQESPLFMSGYVPQVPLWQRGIINVTVLASDNDVSGSVPKFSFYLPNFQQVKGGLDVSVAFRPKSGSMTKPARTQLIPRHYKHQASTSSTRGGKFVDFSVGKEAPSVAPNRPARTDIRIVGSTDLMVTPISCDALLPMVESLSTYVSKLRPSSFLNGSYADCVAAAKRHHKFHEDKILMAKIAEHLAAGPVEKKPKGKKPWLSVPQSPLPRDAEFRFSGVNSGNNSATTGVKAGEKVAPPSMTAGHFLFGDVPWMEKEEVNEQISFNVDQINIVTLQCGIVEEIVQTKDLSSPRDLIGVSALTCSLRSLSAAYTRHGTVTNSAKVFTDRRTSRPLAKPSSKTPVIQLSPLSGIFDLPDIVGADSTVDTVTDSLLHVSVQACHAQLRRLRHSEIWRSARITCITESKSAAWFEYNPKQSPVDDTSPYKRIFHDMAATDQTGFIVLEMGVDHLKIEGGGRTENEEHLSDGHLPDRQAVPTEPLRASTPKKDKPCQPANDSENNSRHSGSSINTFIAHPSEENLGIRQFSPEVGFKLSASLGSVWLNCPTPSKKTTAESAQGPTAIDTSQFRGFTRLDWHFLSTANPVVDAWLYPLDRTNVALKALSATQHKNDIILASYFLIVAVNNHILPKPTKVKQNRHSLMARVLQEDCCCRLARILQRHGLALSPKDIEHAFDRELMPPTDVLEKSIHVLLKQLRYTPFARVLLEPQFLTQKFKSKFKPPQREPGTMDNSVLGLADESYGDDTFFEGGRPPEAVKHPDSPYPPLEQDLNAWLDEEKAKGATLSNRRMLNAGGGPRPVEFNDPHEDSDSPLEDLENGSSLGRQGSVENIFKPILNQLGLQKRSKVSLLKRLIGFHVSLSGRVESAQISLVESVDFSQMNLTSLRKDPTGGRINALKCNQITVTMEALLDIPVRYLDLFVPDYQERLVLSSRLNRVSVVTYKFDMAKVAKTVSMPLLRLLAQIGAVISSMQRVKAELKKKEEMDKRGHKKTDSTSTSGSGTSRSDSPGQPRPRGQENYMDFIAAESSQHWKDLMNLMALYEKPADFQVIDETKKQTRANRSLSFSKTKIPGQRSRSLSFRKKKRQGSDNVSSSGAESEETPEASNGNKRVVMSELSDIESDDEQEEREEVPSSRSVIDALVQRRLKKTNKYGTRVVVSGMASVRRLTFDASLRGLHFQAGLSSLSFNHNFTVRKSRTNRLDESFYHLRTGQLSVQLIQKMGHEQQGQLYLAIGLGASQMAFSSLLRNSKTLGQRSVNVRLGELHFSVPHHPITLHSMVVRGAEDLTDAIDDLKNTAGFRAETSDDSKSNLPSATSKTALQQDRPASAAALGKHPIRTTVWLKKLIVTAAPLPSLEGNYEVTKLLAYGTIGDVAIVHTEFNQQDLIFKSTSEEIESVAKFQLPSLYLKTSYEPIARVKVATEVGGQITEFNNEKALYVTAKAGSPEYTFGTDALKYTVLFQKVFMREIEEVLDTLSQPITHAVSKTPVVPTKRRLVLPFFYQINLQQDGIRITGTTPTSSAVRLEIDKTAVFVSNIPRGSAPLTLEELDHVVVSVQVDLGINLGQLVQGEQQMYEEAQPDFQPYAHFRTRMTFTNYGDGPLEALLHGYDERIRRKRIVAHLSQPRIYLQPRAVDMAVIFYINYKNAYEYWQEQRFGATVRTPSRIRKAQGHLQQVVAQRASQAIQESIYVIELFISQMYVCMPLPTSAMKHTNSGDRDSIDMALLISLDRTKVRAVLAQSIITSGTFDLFRLCFTEDRGPYYDYTGRQDDFTNYCFVPKGYVEVTSRTTKKEASESGLPKWDLYFKWDMNGIEMHMDPSIGKIVSNLSDAMTLFTGEDTEGSAENNPDEVFKPKQGKGRTRLMEKHMQMHAKIVSELKSEGASQQDIQSEAEKLKRIEQGIVHEIRRDLVSRIRQKSMSSKGSLSDYRAHRRTSSTPHEDLSPATPDPDSTHGRTFSADLNRSRTQLATPSLLMTPIRTRVESVKEEPTSPRSSAPEAEQAFDFDFTVLINIESGHCVFYSATDKDKKKNLQNSASSADTSSQNASPTRRPSELSTRRTNLTPCCTLHIPGVNLEMQYESDGAGAGSAQGSTVKSSPEVRAPRLGTVGSRQSMGFSLDGESRKPGVKKKGNLFATFNLESIPAETVLNPQLLDFIEQTLDPIPIVAVQSTMSKEQQASLQEDKSEVDITQNEAPWDVGAAMESFPVDIFILFMMNSTKIRCSCLPTSKVEGVLTLPSLSMMLSTRKTNVVEKIRSNQDNMGTGRPVLDALDKMLHGSIDTEDLNFPELMESYEQHAGMGLFGNLSGFSLVIYHPYGTAMEPTYYDGGVERNVKPGNVSHGMPDKRELVRLELDRLHIEIVRSKCVIEDPSLQTTKTASQHTANSIEFSANVSVGKTTFWYDLRRLGEILAFPKAWYRRSIARRFFLGEEAAETQSTASSGSVDTMREDELKPPEVDRSASPNVRAKVEKKEKDKPEKGTKDVVLPWKTLVLVTFKVSALDFNVNMGNVMGNTVLLVDDINCVARFSAASDGHSDVFACVVASNVDLNSRGGVVGGVSQWRKAQLYGRVRNERGAPPMHAFGCQMHAAESRLEYMGAVSALARMSKMSIRVRDIWALQRLQAGGYRGGPKLTSSVNFTWDQMQVIICSASTSHVVKSIVRVTEFFEEQLKSSRQFISTLNFTGAVVNRRRSSLSRTKESTATPIESRFHRNWQKPLEFLSGYRLQNVPMAPFPDRGGVLRGEVQMNGRTISLACFYGNSFRGKQWARFSIKEPRLLISCEAQQNSLPAEQMVNIIQTMAFHLGNDAGAVHAASVARVTCNNPPPLLNNPDWFEFMFMNSELDEIGRFPSSQGPKVNVFQELRLNMTVETILALPLVTISLRAEHVQTEALPEETATPTVQHNFNCDFGAPISIDMGDSHAFYFLHQLINSYLANTDAESVTSKREVPNPTEILKEDARIFQVNEWYLQPSFKLLQRIGRDIETVGAERVMKRLGFSHAQTTIPKWIQRGLMDPVDKGLSALNLALLMASDHDKTDPEAPSPQQL